jgi:hypothetical protein
MREEPSRRVGDAPGAAEVECVLINDEREHSAAADSVVGADRRAFDARGGDRLCGPIEELRGHHTSWLTRHTDNEVGRCEAALRLTLFVEDTDVDGHDFDAASE